MGRFSDRGDSETEAARKGSSSVPAPLLPLAWASSRARAAARRRGDESSASKLPKPGRSLTDLEGKPLWPVAFSAYQEHQYRFKGFEALHLLGTKHAELELAKFVPQLVRSHELGLEEDMLEDLRHKLRDYCQDIELLEQTLKRKVVLSDEPSEKSTILESERELDESKLYTFANDNLRRLCVTLFPKTYEMLGRFSAIISISDMVSWVCTAFFGGAFLLTPMIIMTFRTSRTARLVTVCVATLLFAMFMGCGTSARKQDILGATAAYAAVMVVYVGTALPS